MDLIIELWTNYRLKIIFVVNGIVRKINFSDFLLHIDKYWQYWLLSTLFSIIVKFSYRKTEKELIF